MRGSCSDGSKTLRVKVSCSVSMETPESQSWKDVGFHSRTGLALPEHYAESHP